ncbi:hypothetical protein HWV62_16560 [Athelia sp. TMB]|nr:hypothetical protein HWV62_16560 [Athelia sp. TMB]
MKNRLDDRPYEYIGIFVTFSGPASNCLKLACSGAIVSLDSESAFLFLSAVHVGHIGTQANASPKGLGIVTALAARPDTIVFAGARNPGGATALAKLVQAYPGNVYTVQLTSGSRADNEAAVEEIQKVAGRLDAVIANAGISNFIGPAVDTPEEKLREHYEVNVIGTHVLFSTTYALLSASPNPKFIAISSAGGSIAQGTPMPRGMLAYGASKAALNYLVRKVHFEYPDLVAFPISPGAVATDLAKKSASAALDPELAKKYKMISVEESAAAILKLVDEATREKDGGKFLNYDGTIWECPTNLEINGIALADLLINNPRLFHARPSSGQNLRNMSQPGSRAPSADAAPSNRRPSRTRRGRSRTPRQSSVEASSDDSPPAQRTKRRGGKGKQGPLGGLPALDEVGDLTNGVTQPVNNAVGTVKGAAGAVSGVADGLTGGGEKKGGKSDNGALSLRLDLNLELEVTLTAKLHGDLTLSLL